MSKESKIKAEIAEYKELLKDKTIPADERAFAESEIQSLEEQLGGSGDKKPAKSSKKKPGHKAPIVKKQTVKNNYKFNGKDVKNLSDTECDHLMEQIRKRREKATASSEKSKSKPVIEKATGNVVTAVKQVIENVPVADIDSTEIKKFERLQKAGEVFVSEMKAVLGPDYDKEAVTEEFSTITKLIDGLKKKLAKK